MSDLDRALYNEIIEGLTLNRELRFTIIAIPMVLLLWGTLATLER